MSPDPSAEPRIRRNVVIAIVLFCVAAMVGTMVLTYLRIPHAGDAAPPGPARASPVLRR